MTPQELSNIKDLVEEDTIDRKLYKRAIWIIMSEWGMTRKEVDDWLADEDYWDEA